MDSDKGVRQQPKRQKPKIPKGYREVPVLESIESGDLRWNPVKNDWVVIAPGVNIAVLTRWAGWYCRKIAVSPKDF